MSYMYVLYRLLLQIHDELLLEVPEKEINKVTGRTLRDLSHSETNFLFGQAL